MKRTLIFDTETTGKRPKVGRGQSLPPEREPAVVQLAAMLFLDRRPVAHLSCFIEPLRGDGSVSPVPDPQLAPDGVLSPKDYKFFEDSGITQETVDAVGMPNKVGMAMFYNMAKVADRKVAHNIMFDDPIIRAGFKRAGVPDTEYANKPGFCTMKTLEPILKLPGKYGYKFPTLDESYRALVNPEGFDGAHDAMVDVVACAEVLWAIEDGLEAGDERFSGQSLWNYC